MDLKDVPAASGAKQVWFFATGPSWHLHIDPFQHDSLEALSPRLSHFLRSWPVCWPVCRSIGVVWEVNVGIDGSPMEPVPGLRLPREPGSDDSGRRWKGRSGVPSERRRVGCTGHTRRQIEGGGGGTGRSRPTFAPDQVLTHTLHGTAIYAAPLTPSQPSLA